MNSNFLAVVATHCALLAGFRHLSQTDGEKKKQIVQEYRKQ